MITFTYNSKKVEKKLNNILLRDAHMGDKTSRKLIIRKVKIEFTSRENEQVLFGRLLRHKVAVTRVILFFRLHIYILYMFYVIYLTINFFFKINSFSV